MSKNVIMDEALMPAAHSSKCPPLLKGDIILAEKEWPEKLYNVNSGAVRWLFRHPLTGLIESVQEQISPSEPIGAIALLQGMPCEHAIASTPLKADSLSPDAWLEELHIKPSLWPKLQPFELLQGLQLECAELPWRELNLPRFGIALCNALELLPPLWAVTQKDLCDLTKPSQESAIWIGSGQITALFFKALQHCSANELNQLAQLSHTIPLRLYRLRKADPIALEDRPLWLAQLARREFASSSTAAAATPPPLHFSDQAALTSIAIDAIELDLLHADDTLPAVVALLLMAAQACQISPRTQRLLRSQALLDKQDEANTEPLSLFTRLSLLASLTELRLLQQPATYRGLLIDRKPFFAPHPQSGNLCLWQPREGLRFALFDPTSKATSPEYLNLLQLSNGLQPVLSVEADPTSNGERFNFSWFFPELARHKLALTIILVSSLFIQILQLANPLIIQQIIDLVLNDRSLKTLYSMGFLLIVLAFFQSVLTGLRAILFTETTNRIDVRMGTRIIDHLLHLPISYFDKRPVGEVSTRVGELENIRSFLTGQALTVFLDVLFGVIYIVVMLIYSVPLTIAALATVPISVMLAVVFSPIIKAKIDDRSVAYAKTSSFLVEHLAGIMTVKSQNIEDLTRVNWRRRYIDFVQKGFSLASIGTIVGETNNFLNLLSGVLVMFVGAVLVIDGKLSLGQLIAFRIISGYVTAPIMRLSTLWQSVQELSVSVQRLADIVESRSEPQAQKSRFALPPVKGEVELVNLSFKYPETNDLVIKRLNHTIPAGSFVGVVGSSGSGKSTLMKLLPLIYIPSGGTILVDGYDILKVDLDSLRSQIGIVPQEPLLFAGTVWDNLTVGSPGATQQAVEEAVRAAEAYEFIMQMPDGFESEVGERGGRLSGGQRQRLSIARALLINPSLLILDEATSALDYRTEAAVCRNLFRLLRGRTVLFVTHRLATIRHADEILMMDRGLIAEHGTYDELIAKGCLFAALSGCQNKDEVIS